MSEDRSDLPEEWEVASLGSVCEINPRRVRLKGVPDDTPVTFVPMAAVDANLGAITQAVVRPLREVKKGYTAFTDGDVLFAKITPCMENGKAAIARNLESGLGFGSTEFHVLRPSSAVLNEYVWWFVRQRTFRQMAEESMTGSVGQLRVPPDFMAHTPIPLPPRVEQERIVEAISRTANHWRAAVTHLDGARRAIEQFRQAVRATASSGRLTADWRDTDPVRTPAESVVQRSIDGLEHVGERPQRYLMPPEPQLNETPTSWQWAPLGWLAVIKGGIQKQPKRTPKQNAYPYLRVANVRRGELDLEEIHEFELFDGELDTYRLEPGDLLVIEGNGSLSEIGRSAVWQGAVENCVHQNHIIRVRSLEVLPAFLDLYWNSPYGAQQIQDRAVTTAGLYNLSTKKVASFLVPVPPPEEQIEIVRRVGLLLALADSLIARIEAAGRRVDHSSNAVLAKAFRGELLTIAL